MPDLQGLVVFCQQHLGWPEEETKTLISIIMGILQLANDNMRQTRLDSYTMKYEDELKFAIIRSKPLQSVLKKKGREKEENKITTGRDYQVVG
jgi:hypothetical protein